MEYSLDQLGNIRLDIGPGDLVFLYGDLGAGKTSLIRGILSKQFGVEGNIMSPTYIHYKKYGDRIYHFDLYRLESYDDFVNIGGEEILEDLKNICFVEWPELIESRYKPKAIIRLSRSDSEDVRKIDIEYP